LHGRGKKPVGRKQRGEAAKDAGFVGSGRGWWSGEGSHDDAGKGVELNARRRRWEDRDFGRGRPDQLTLTVTHDFANLRLIEAMYRFKADVKAARLHRF